MLYSQSVWDEELVLLATLSAPPLAPVPHGGGMRSSTDMISSCELSLTEFAE